MSVSVLADLNWLDWLVVAVLVLTLKVPSLMRAHAGDGLGVARYLVYRQIGRGLEGGGKGGA